MQADFACYKHNTYRITRSSTGRKSQRTSRRILRCYCSPRKTVLQPNKQYQVLATLKSRALFTVEPRAIPVSPQCTLAPRGIMNTLSTKPFYILVNNHSDCQVRLFEAYDLNSKQNSSRHYTRCLLQRSKRFPNRNPEANNNHTYQILKLTQMSLQRSTSLLMTESNKRRATQFYNSMTFFV